MIWRGGGPVQVLYGPRLRYQFDRWGDLYHYRYTLDQYAVHDLMLPADETNLEWTLMNRRIERLKIQLGDEIEKHGAESELRRYDPEGLLAYTLTAPFDEVLTQPRPEHIANTR